MRDLDIELVRNEFPGLNSEWTFFDNAGGSQILGRVITRMHEYLRNSNVQLGATYDVSQEAGSKVKSANEFVRSLINAKDTSEIIIGSSTTMLIHLLAESMGKTLGNGDEIIISNSDHEANIGPWVNLSGSGVKIKFWELNKDTLKLEREDLAKLISNKTKIIALTNASNILGTLNPIKEISGLAHQYGAKICVDGVAFAPHRKIDVLDTDVDFYTLSFYKVFGPHLAVLYGKSEILRELPGLNHSFIGEDEIPYKFQPGNQNFELSYSLLGIEDYIDIIFNSHGKELNSHGFDYKINYFYECIAQHEAKLSGILLDYLNSNKKIKIIGEKSSDPNFRVPTISFVVDGKRSDEITSKVDKFKIGIRYGHFYAKRLIDYLDLDKKNGVVRVSMVHYNSEEEVYRLTEILDKII